MRPIPRTRASSQLLSDGCARHGGKVGIGDVGRVARPLLELVREVVSALLAADWTALARIRRLGLIGGAHLDLCGLEVGITAELLEQRADGARVRACSTRGAGAPVGKAFAKEGGAHATWRQGA